MTEDWKPWTSEAAMVADFSAFATKAGWVAYAETAGWDVLLARPEDGFQIGIEAKLSLNAKVLCQVLERERWGGEEGPDVHAVLVPAIKAVGGLQVIAARLGVVVIEGSGPHRWASPKGPIFAPRLPTVRDDVLNWREDWPERCPDRRHPLPDYVPDVTGGHSAPVKLTAWKIAALKAMALLETRGAITRADLKALRLHPSRWTQYWLKSDGQGGWVETKNTPNFRVQHPVNYEQIKADIEKWTPPLPAKAAAA